MNELFEFSAKPFDIENNLMRDGFRWVAGIDEVGRGCLAGPVVAAAVILNPQQISITDRIRDSKKLTPEVREELYDIILHEAVTVGIGMIHHDIIDEINILRATFEAMKVALSQLNQQPDMCLVDGNQKIPIMTRQLCIIKGDDLVKSIGAASIVAKVIRDRWMKQMADKYPHYAFEKNKGYGSEEHVAGIRTHGYCEIHRRSFTLKSMQEIDSDWF